MSRPLAKHERLERWAMLLARDPERQLASVEEVEYGTVRQQQAKRADNSALSVAFADPVCASRASRATGSAMPRASSSCRTGKSINWSARAITDARWRPASRRCACERSQSGRNRAPCRAPDWSLPASRPRRSPWSSRSFDVGRASLGARPLTDTARWHACGVAPSPHGDWHGATVRRGGDRACWKSCSRIRSHIS